MLNSTFEVCCVSVRAPGQQFFCGTAIGFSAGEGVTGVTFPERLRTKFRGDPVWASCSLKSYWRSVVRLIVEAQVAHVFSLVFSFLGVHYKGKDGICDRSVVVGRGRGQELDV